MDWSYPEIITLRCNNDTCWMFSKHRIKWDKSAWDSIKDDPDRCFACPYCDSYITDRPLDIKPLVLGNP